MLRAVPQEAGLRGVGSRKQPHRHAQLVSLMWLQPEIDLFVVNLGVLVFAKIVNLLEIARSARDLMGLVSDGASFDGGGRDGKGVPVEHPRGVSQRDGQTSSFFGYRAIPEIVNFDGLVEGQ
jgi:hypothetical protein